MRVEDSLCETDLNAQKLLGCLIIVFLMINSRKYFYFKTLIAPFRHTKINTISWSSIYFNISWIRTKISALVFCRNQMHTQQANEERRLTNYLFDNLTRNFNSSWNITYEFINYDNYFFSEEKINEEFQKKGKRHETCPTCRYNGTTCVPHGE